MCSLKRTLFCFSGLRYSDPQRIASSRSVCWPCMHYVGDLIPTKEQHWSWPLGVRYCSTTTSFLVYYNTVLRNLLNILVLILLYCNLWDIK